jgi:hypothetical protein
MEGSSLLKTRRNVIFLQNSIWLHLPSCQINPISNISNGGIGILLHLHLLLLLLIVRIDLVIVGLGGEIVVVPVLVIDVVEGVLRGIVSGWLFAFCLLGVWFVGIAVFLSYLFQPLVVPLVSHFRR